jgi:ABC-2 type transport system permease protein
MGRLGWSDHDDRLYRGAGLDIVWPQFIALAVIGVVLFSLSLGLFRRALGGMA